MPQGRLNVQVEWVVVYGNKIPTSIWKDRYTYMGMSDTYRYNYMGGQVFLVPITPICIPGTYNTYKYTYDTYWVHLVAIGGIPWYL